MPDDDPEVTALLDANTAPARGLRRLTTLGERLLLSATGEPLTDDEARDARHELETAREGIERLDAMLTTARDDEYERRRLGAFGPAVRKAVECQPTATFVLIPDPPEPVRMPDGELTLVDFTGRKEPRKH